MRILIDLDDVLNDLARAILFWNNRIHNTNYKYEEISRFTWLPDTFGPQVWLPLLTHDFWQDLDYDSEGFEFINWAKEREYEIYIVSSSFVNKMLGIKLDDLLDEAYSFSYHNCVANPIHSEDIIICQNKYLIQGDVLIDDNPDNLSKFPGEKVLFAQPWNKDVKDYIRTDSWESIKTIIQRLAKTKEIELKNQ